MKKLFSIMCLSLILSAVTHVSTGHERAKGMKTEMSFSKHCPDVINLAVVDYSTNFVVDSTTVVAPESNCMYNHLVVGAKPIFRPFDHGLCLKSRITKDTRKSGITSNTFATIIEPSLRLFDHGSFVKVNKRTYHAPFVDDSYIWKYSVQYNC